MEYQETVNCYCFNPECSSSIFQSRDFSGLSVPIDNFFSGTVCCHECKTELVSKTVLELRSEITKAFYKKKPLQAIVIDDDPFFQIIAEHALKRDLSITETHYNYNGADAMDYLKAHKKLTDYLPDFIFVDINMPVMDGWQFLDEYEKLLAELDKKSVVYITSGNVSAAYKKRTKKYRFVKGLIAKPFDINTLKHLVNAEIPNC